MSSADALGAPSETADAGDVEELRAALAEAKARIVQLETLAHVDELTGLLNRRGFRREIERAASYSQRYDVAVVLVMIDLDGFKAINDTHGHPAGDAALVHVAKLLSSSVRASDIVARLGGDEFALLLWHADMAAAAGAMIKLQAKLGASPLMFDGAQIGVRASVGLSALTATRPIEEAIAEADRHLYAAKQYRHAGGQEPGQPGGR
ncbi:GGDEF domain-containing protein [uncultured Alsobacter sp.]|uniref:GGDEF domain-containing protein n=1 Tax=uncultured Alsobacter sp. TaxID=1748258 RepID=UPI0025F38D04|nr:GGDEF domain-containing protein [uncultured Alsobacter sp.]